MEPIDWTLKVRVQAYGTYHTRPASNASVPTMTTAMSHGLVTHGLLATCDSVATAWRQQQARHDLAHELV